VAPSLGRGRLDLRIGVLAAYGKSRLMRAAVEKVTFNRVALHDGKLADVNKDVQIQPATE